MSQDTPSHVPAGRLVLIRHGETEWSRSGRHTGRTDVALTQDGERQAAALRAALRGCRFVLVATSPRTRAARTADLAGLRPASGIARPAPDVADVANAADLANVADLANATDLPNAANAGAADGMDEPGPVVAGREVWPELAEWDYGDLEGLTTTRIRERRPGWTIWHGPVPGGEDAAAVAARADAVLSRAVALLRDGDVALVGHGHFSRVLIARWLGLGPARGASFLLEPASVSVLAHERETRVLGQLNLRPALESPTSATAPAIRAPAAAT